MQPKLPRLSRKHLGKWWIAWNREATKIIATGRTLAEVRRAARAAGEPMPRLEKVPQGLFVGCLRA